MIYLKHFRATSTVALLISGLLGLSLSGCGSKQTETASSPSLQLRQQQQDNSSDEVNREETEGKKYLLQVTALNFLKGGREQCNVYNRIYLVNQRDNGRKIVVCENSRVELSMMSHQGVISYQAIDLSTHRELRKSSGPNDVEYVLGETAGMTRYSVDNPYGYTYLMVEDVTDVNEELLKELNESSPQPLEI